MLFVMIPTWEGFVEQHMFVPCHKEIQTLKRNHLLQTNVIDWKEKETITWDRLERNVVAQGSFFHFFFSFFGGRGGGGVAVEVETENSMKTPYLIDWGWADVQSQSWEVLDLSRRASRDTDFYIIVTHPSKCSSHDGHRSRVLFSHQQKKKSTHRWRGSFRGVYADCEQK